MRLGELHAWISVDGVELSEFAVEYSADGKEASCWIPSECDKRFSVEWKNTRSSSRQTVNAQVTVDGTKCGNSNMRCRDPLHPQIASGNRDSVATSAHSRQPFLFAQQALTDDDNLLNAAISPELGSVKVQIRKVVSVPSRRPSRPVWSRHSFESKVLHERSKKAIGHSVQFGAVYPARNSKSDPIDVIANLATFVFKYRPIELLRAQGIAPPEVRPEAAATPTEVVDLTADDDDAVEIKQLEARLRVLKKKSVKQERSSMFAPGEVIDLT
ncbi:hypothetical protein B0H14DRAFT_3006632 [Mycena olivaceomarginata]|nr:hypothetical protein B0H14DRAFT_3006632 [Mycena olivaceomarginata]